MGIFDTLQRFSAIVDVLIYSDALTEEEQTDLVVIEAELYSYAYNTERELQDREQL
jgi:hypothetical protein